MRMKILFFLVPLIFNGTFFFAQEREISGTVTSNDRTGAFLGATVLVKGTSIGTTKDIDGILDWYM